MHNGSKTSLLKREQTSVCFLPSFARHGIFLSVQRVCW